MSLFCRELEGHESIKNALSFPPARVLRSHWPSVVGDVIGLRRIGSPPDRTVSSSHVTTAIVRRNAIRYASDVALLTATGKLVEKKESLDTIRRGGYA